MADTDKNDVKEENQTEEQKDEGDESKKASPKKISKSPVKKDAEPESEDEDEIDDEGPQVGLLDKPVEVIKGTRDRKKVERLSFQDTKSSSNKEKFEIKEGRGTKLGEIERVELQLKKANSDALKPLHRLLFSRPGSAFEIKRNIRKFSGFPFSRDASDYEKKENILIKFTVSGLKEFCEWLDLEKGGGKEELIHRILDFLLEPKPSGKALPKPKKKRGEKRKRASKAKKDKKKKTEKKEKKSKSKKKEEILSSDDDSDNEDEDDEEEEEMPKKKQKTDKSPKKSPKKTPQKTPKKKEKASTTKKEKKQKKETPKKDKKRKVSVSSDSSDDEPLVKRVKSPPTDAEIRDVIKKILDGANLEEITMKTVCKQVYAKYPDFDLSERKDFIKSTVRQIIS
ncbi:protein DEK-like [Ptychodera flava]|uniref:protein DEK-like n=1 Tax=Ptychodera flava TaxID=63121 RepID=UPI00396AAFB4